MPQSLLIIITLSNSILLALILFWIFNKNCVQCQQEMTSWKRIIMNKEPIIFMSALGGVGYITFHGHLKNQDCWLCPYRGWAFLGSSVILGTWLAFQEKE